MSGPDPLDRDAKDTAARWIQIFADGPIDLERQIEFEMWLDADSAHRAAFGRLAALWRATGALATLPEMAPVRSDAAMALRGDRRRAWERFAAPGFRRLLAIAACLAILIAGTIAVLPGHSRTYRTAIGELRVVTLADGSHLSLDSATSVTVAYTPQRRTVRLIAGRAKFDVAKDPRRPFTVSAGGRMVVATGTAFSVEIVRSQLQVVLYQGSVAVLEDGPTDQPPLHLGLAASTAPADAVLVPGRALIAALDRPSARVVDIDPARSLSWQSGRINFTDEPLAIAIARMNRYSPQQVVVADEATGRLRISGAFNAGDVAGFVDGISALYRLRRTDTADTIVLARTPMTR